MACKALALALQLHPFLPRSTPSHHPRAAAASPARTRRRAPSVRCCAAAGDQAEPPQDAVLKAISRSDANAHTMYFFIPEGSKHTYGGNNASWIKEHIFSEVASSKGRVAHTTNVIMGGTVTDDATDEWLVLDKKANSYPTVRGFTAIGTGGDDFVQSMVIAVESVLQERIPKGQISLKVSSKGKYISVKIGPIRVVSSEQVQAVYNAMKKDERMKFFL